MGLYAAQDGERSAVARTLALLNAVAVSPGATLAEIARASSMPRSSAHRLAASLIERRFLVVLSRGRYFPGPNALALSGNFSFRDLLVGMARPHIARLAQECRAHAHLGILEDGQVTYAVKHPFGRAKLFSREGAQLEAYCTAVGKALLAQLDPASLDQYLSQDSFVALTSRTITDKGELRSEIRGVRKRGWATEAEEAMPGLACLAVPLSIGGPNLAAISISLQGADASDENLVRHLPAIRRVASRISSSLAPHAA